MSFSATRMTCYALLSAIEHDLRDAVETHIGDSLAEDVLPAGRLERAQERRLKDRLPAANDLPGVLPYLDFGDVYELLMSQAERIPDALSDSLRSIASSVPRIIAIRNRVAHTRPMEIDDSAILLDAGQTLLASASEWWAELLDTTRRLTSDPSHVLGLTIDLSTDPDPGPQHNLPIPDFDETGFFGRQEELRRVKKAIKGAYPVVSVLGDGGIGKTSIALKAAYDLIEEGAQTFDAIVWVTAKATILTPHEIKRINGAIESSLQVFTRAAHELGGSGSDDPMSDVREYMEAFRILLVLDNLETVLDGKLRDFLTDLPMGSKVLVTSRIGLGMVENPIQLQPLSDDDSVRLLRTLARIRNVTTLTELGQPAMESIASQMAGHPAYIRWFVAGVQAGRRPEEIIGNNELLLDFCMSNVYEYLSDRARKAVRSMQVLPGGRNQGEIAHVNEFSAADTQETLLELLTTNFVHMSSQSSGQSLDTFYQLSDFARQYLDKHHPVRHDERQWLVERNQELMDLGFEYSLETTSSPYAAETVTIRGQGDVHAARLLREAIRTAPEDPNAALALCEEAQRLAPTYYEGWRVEGEVHAATGDRGAARAAYESAWELAPQSAAVGFHFGSFLLDVAGDPAASLSVLHKAARLDDQSPDIAGQIAWAHYCLGNMFDCTATVTHILEMHMADSDHRKAAVTVALRAAVDGTEGAVGDDQEIDAAVELLEVAVEVLELAPQSALSEERFDRMLLLKRRAEQLRSVADGYAAKKSRDLEGRLLDLIRMSKGENTRWVASIRKILSDKRFGFLRTAKTDYFFHYRNLLDLRDWEMLEIGSTCAFDPVKDPKGLRAERVRLLT
jgi:hypothetical protein